MAKNEMTAVDRRRGQMRKSLKDMLHKGRERYAAVLPKHITPERMANLALTAATLNPKLLDCSPESVCLALLCASQTGLEPDGYNGHLIPYGSQCTFVPDFKGLIQLALKNGVVVDAQPVYDNDEFNYQLGTDPKIEHYPALDTDRGELRCAYAVARFKDGRTKFVVATKADCEKRRDASASKNKNDSPWNQWTAEMYCKTAVKMISKYLPRSPELTAAVTADDAAEVGVQQQPTGLPGQMPHPEPRRKIDDLAEQAFSPTGAAEPDTGPKLGDPVGAFVVAVDSVETIEEVDQLFQTMIVENKHQITEEDILKASQARDERHAVINGELK